MNIPFLDLKKVNNELQNEIELAMKEVIDSGWYVLGGAGARFEENLKKYLCGNNEGYVVGCNSGTDALILSLLASGIGYGDEVITVSHTAAPTIAAICAVGAVPVFVDINSETWLMDITKIEAALTLKTKAIIPVHLYGNVVDINEIQCLLRAIKREEIIIIEDVAQAQGSFLKEFQAGTIGRFGAFSFYPSKNIGALGDGGAVFCKKAEDAERIKMLRFYGQRNRYSAELCKGINSRLDEIQAAILDVKLRYLNIWNNKKGKIVNLYKDGLAQLPLEFQKVTESAIPGWHLFVIRLECPEIRDNLMEFLQNRGIQSLIHYPVPNHKQKAFASFTKFVLPMTENLVDRIVSLPMNVILSDIETEVVIDSIKLFFKGKC